MKSGKDFDVVLNTLNKDLKLFTDPLWNMKKSSIKLKISKILEINHIYFSKQIKQSRSHNLASWIRILNIIMGK
jgi:hypothetical protein